MSDQQQPQPEKWRLTKDVSVVDIVSILTAAGAVMFAYTTLAERTSLLESAVVEIRSTQRDEKAALAARLDRMENKLDRLIERASR
ncbi:MAG: hypothetical protein ING91_19500 [Rhodocyclaceae bacterium]|nr:hypothetical protein [Rhodocyclaceae bacterium]MCA3848773.1 hypothetical protein [Burkholderia sp.]